MKVGVLWDKEVEWNREKPFDIEANDTYELFSEKASGKNVEIYLAKYSWFSEGVLKKAWRYKNGWKKVQEIRVDLVHDKFKTDEETLELKKWIDSEIGILNVPELEVLCKDKLKTYRKFSQMVPETRKASEENIESMLEKYGKVVLKPRTGYGGEGIKILNDEDEIPEVEAEEYVVQRFVDSSGGIPGITEGYHDLRAIMVDGELCGTYLRCNQGSEISNVAEGGEKIAVGKDQFPEEAKHMAEEVAEELGYENSVISVDFFYDQEGNPWIVELNTKPGLNFYDDEDLKREIERVMDAVIGCYLSLGS